jgi:hypothetical protein
MVVCITEDLIGRQDGKDEPDWQEEAEREHGLPDPVYHVAEKLFRLRNGATHIQGEVHPHTASYPQVARARICKHLRSPGIQPASPCSLAGRYVKLGCRTGPPGWESILCSLKRFTNTGSGDVNLYIDIKHALLFLSMDYKYKDRVSVFRVVALHFAL